MKLHRRDLVKLLGVAGALPLPAAQTAATPHNTLLRDLCEKIIPGAGEAGVPALIELLASENEEYQRQLTGGLTWLDAACRDRFGKAFLDCQPDQQTEMLDLIAYRKNAEADPSLKQGVAFFAFLRDLTLDGYFTSRAGVDSLGFQGNKMLSGPFPGCPSPEGSDPR